MKRSKTRQSVVNTNVADHIGTVGGSRLANLPIKNKGLPHVPRQRRPLTMGEQAERELSRRSHLSAQFWYSGKD